MPEYRFENLHHYGPAKVRLKSGRYWRTSDHTPESDRMVILTSERAAHQDMEHNFQALSQELRRAGADYYIEGQKGLQVISGERQSTDVAEALDQYHEAWVESDPREYSRTNPSFCRCEINSLDRAVVYYSWHDIYHIPVFYDLNQARAITGKQRQIQLLWDLGWLSRLGSPAQVATEIYGTREEIEMRDQVLGLAYAAPGRSNLWQHVSKTYNGIDRWCNYPTKGEVSWHR